MAGFIIFIFIFIILTLLLYYRRVRQYYIDKSISELRECKHGIIMFMSENVLKLNDSDFKELKSFLSLINNTTLHFSQIGGLRFSTVRIVIENTLVSTDKLEKRLPEIIEKHQELLNHFGTAVNYSLKAIPFLKLRLISHLIKLLLNILIVLGIKGAKNYLSKFEKFLKVDGSNNFNNHCLN